MLAGENGYTRFGKGRIEADLTAIAGMKQENLIRLIPILMTPLKGEGFRLEDAGGDSFDGKPVDTVRVTGPGGIALTLSILRDTGLPVMMVRKVKGEGDAELTEETTFHDYKKMSGINKATRIVKVRRGEPFFREEHRITEFKVLDRVDPKKFSIEK